MDKRACLGQKQRKTNKKQIEIRKKQIRTGPKIRVNRGSAENEKFRGV